MCATVRRQPAPGNPLPNKRAIGDLALPRHQPGSVSPTRLRRIYRTGVIGFVVAANHSRMAAYDRHGHQRSLISPKLLCASAMHGGVQDSGGTRPQSARRHRAAKRRDRAEDTWGPSSRSTARHRKAPSVARTAPSGSTSAGVGHRRQSPHSPRAPLRSSAGADAAPEWDQEQRLLRAR